MTNLSTQDVARKVGVHRVTLERWLSGGKLDAPKIIRFGRNEFRNWTPADVERVKRFKAENYCKGRGRKPRKKQAHGAS